MDMVASGFDCQIYHSFINSVWRLIGPAGLTLSFVIVEHGLKTDAIFKIVSHVTCLAIFEAIFILL